MVVKRWPAISHSVIKQIMVYEEQIWENCTFRYICPNYKEAEGDKTSNIV